MRRLTIIIDHDELNPTSTDDEGRVVYYGFQSTSEAQMAVTERVEGFRSKLPAAFDGEAGFNALFDGKKARPIVVNYFATLLGIQATPPRSAPSAEPVMTVSIFRTLTGFALSADALREEDFRVLELVNRRLH